MRQIVIVLAAMALGLATGRLTGGFPFSPAICIVAGVFLVTPSLFRFGRSDLTFAAHELKPIALNLVLNFAALPLAALGIGWLTGDLGLAAALLLLAMLPGGGMVMHWIKSSGADVRLGFLLSVVNLAMVLPVTLVFAALPGWLGPYFPPPDLGGVGAGSGIRIPPFAPFMILIVLPFILSQWLKSDAPGLVARIERHQSRISQAVIAGIVFYLFGLETSQLIFAVPAATFATAALATLAFYAVAIALATWLTPASGEGRAIYWHMVTRYITLALILASFSLPTFGASFLLPVMIAYVIQFSAAGVLRGRMAARARAPESVPADDRGAG
ncbi:hypothetical protein [Sinisalibacter aestuarii]|uniref:Bile acid:sodium symporter n=1 Tax=Sinisalibacter aestuarii TaxID=2949426 RepID=A0ABQ5LY13_9RHOB|nr:hypothetical protein [Sinisalibacter aestuarii]GKY88987.1 hypothetical protein STA1M1_28560 [Sinisalibacter aestuarii]